jgi:hypothetical protein
MTCVKSACICSGPFCTASQASGRSDSSCVIAGTTWPACCTQQQGAHAEGVGKAGMHMDV